MTAVGFEPTPLTRLRPERSALDRSAKLSSREKKVEIDYFRVQQNFPPTEGPKAAPPLGEPTACCTPAPPASGPVTPTGTTTDVSRQTPRPRAEQSFRALNAGHGRPAVAFSTTAVFWFGLEAWQVSPALDQ